MSEQTANLVDALRARLHATMRRITMADVAQGALLILGLVGACWLLLTGLESQFWLSTTARTVLVSSLAAAVAALLIVFIAQPILRALGYWGHLTENDVARRIGEHYPEVADRLRNLLDLVDGRRTNSPSTLVDRAALRLGRAVEQVPFENVEDFRGVRRTGRWMLAPVLLLLLFLGVAPSTFTGASSRLLSPTTSFEKPAPFHFQVTPGAVQLVKGDSLRISAHTDGDEVPTAVTLAVRHTDEKHIERITLTPDSSGRVRHTLVNVRKPLQYRLSADPITSSWYDVHLTDRPLLDRIRLRLDYPDYTHRPDRRLNANVGDVKALSGTEVQVETRVGGAAPDTAFLQFRDGSSYPLHLDGRAARGQFTLEQNGSYQVQLRSRNGATNRAPVTYQTQLLSDEPPSVTLTQPSTSAKLDESLEQGLRMRLVDDFGFSALRLYWRRAQSDKAEPMQNFKRLRLPLDNPRQLDQAVAHLWKLTPSTGLDLQPGDVIAYYVKVWDNNAVADYQSARTETHRLRYPSRAEQYDQVDEQQSGAQESIEDALQKSGQVNEEFRRLHEEVRRKRSADWEDKRQLDKLQKQQQAVESQVEEAKQQMQRMSDQMKRNSLTDEKTQKLYEELQRVMDEVNAPEMEKAMQQLRKDMENMNMKQLQQQFKNTKQQQQQYRRRLKRALSLFKKAKTRQQMDEVARRAKELAEQEKSLAKQTEKRRQTEQEKNDVKQKGKQKKEESNPSEADNTSQSKQGEQNHKGDKKGERNDRNAQKNNGEQDRKGGAEKKKPSTGKRQKKNKSGQKSSPQKTDAKKKGQKNKSANEDLARKQDAARKKMKELQKKMQKLQKEMSSQKGAPKKQMQKLQKQMRKSKMQKQMQKNSRQLRQNKMQKASQGQKKMQKQLQQMSMQMQKMKKGMQQKSRRINLAGLRQALSNVLMLSKQQEGLRMGVQGLSAGDAQLRPYARRQRKLTDGLRTVSDTLQHLANDVPQMRREVQEEAGSALEEMNTAVDQMTQRHAGRAAGRQKASMMHLNELALMLSDLLTNLQQSGGSGGGMSSQQLMQKLQQMAGQQQKLNQQIQKMLNDVQGKRLSPNKQKRLRQMARQQEALQRELEKLSRNRNVRGKALGDLKKIADQMKKTVKEMRKRGASRRTIQRQRQIHTRLLEAQQSINKRGKKKERKSKTGKDIQRQSPDEVTPKEQAEKLRRDLIRALEKGYAPDYEQLIKRYFELLQKSSDQ